ncbi:TetR/AcrR family transcriptional regulator [Mycoplasmatota bacterium WC44]
MRVYNDSPRINILSSAKEIALEQGINKINIRSVAQKTGVSIGTVYNYYATKADLVVAVIEGFWTEAFEKIDFKKSKDKDFYEKLQDIYDSLDLYLQNFKENWLDQISLLSSQEKKLGRKKQTEYFARVCTIIISLMDRDENINSNIWENGVSKEQTAEFIFDNLLIMLKKDDSDFDFFIRILKKVMSY